MSNIENATLRSKILETIADRSVTLPTLIKRVVAFFGAANITDAEVSRTVAMMIGSRQIAKQENDKRSATLHIPNANRSDLAVELSKYITSRKVVSEETLRARVKTMMEAEGETFADKSEARTINAAVMGLMRSEAFVRLHTAKGYVVATKEAAGTVTTSPVQGRTISERGAKIAATRAANKAAKANAA